VAAREILSQQGVAARVVSMPCWELFEEQPKHIVTPFWARER
jgi:transketolase